MVSNIKKFSVKELANKLQCSYPTALKEKRIILDSLAVVNRNYLIIQDIEKFYTL